MVSSAATVGTAMRTRSKNIAAADRAALIGCLSTRQGHNHFATATRGKKALKNANKLSFSVKIGIFGRVQIISVLTNHSLPPLFGENCPLRGISKQIIHFIG
ncbi:MAG TPA: hypothetical protein D7H97_06275 [Candidatus Poseidoniales archaeon]|nr:MAG TPA: hypothetical protein D7H97_06275 [Candidatus Poseidoniales archaeon]